MSSENPASILLVDDDPVQLRVRETILHDAGFNVAVATSAEVALALLRADQYANKFNAVVTDHVLPGASGVEFVRQIRSMRPMLPVIVLTGMLTAEPEYQGTDVTFRVKPVHPAELIETLQAALRESKENR
jgi:DNA-binding NtrC family response regulator